MELPWDTTFSMVIPRGPKHMKLHGTHGIPCEITPWNFHVESRGVSVEFSYVFAHVAVAHLPVYLSSQSTRAHVQ